MAEWPPIYRGAISAAVNSIGIGAVISTITSLSGYLVLASNARYLGLSDFFDRSFEDYPYQGVRFFYGTAAHLPLSFFTKDLAALVAAYLLIGLFNRRFAKSRLRQQWDMLWRGNIRVLAGLLLLPICLALCFELFLLLPDSGTPQALFDGPTSLGELDYAGSVAHALALLLLAYFAWRLAYEAWPHSKRLKIASTSAFAFLGLLAWVSLASWFGVVYGPREFNVITELSLKEQAPAQKGCGYHPLLLRMTGDAVSLYDRDRRRVCILSRDGIRSLQLGRKEPL